MAQITLNVNFADYRNSFVDSQFQLTFRCTFIAFWSNERPRWSVQIWNEKLRALDDYCEFLMNSKVTKQLDTTSLKTFTFRPLEARARCSEWVRKSTPPTDRHDATRPPKIKWATWREDAKKLVSKSFISIFSRLRTYVQIGHFWCKTAISRDLGAPDLCSDRPFSTQPLESGAHLFLPNRSYFI